MCAIRERPLPPAIVAQADERDDLAELPKVAPPPDVLDRATIAALVAAFGSDDLRKACERWRESVRQFDTDLEAQIP
jgi:hypothetical protein